MGDPFVPDRAVLCPYDATHTIAESRFQRHIIKCSKNFPPGYRLSCPYNAAHRLARPDIHSHIAECPDRNFADPVIYGGVSSAGSVTNFAMEDRSIIDYDENWDDEDGTLDEVSSISDLENSAKPMMHLSSHQSSIGLSIRKFVEPQIIGRTPLARAEALMIEESEDSAAEDMKSVKSFMCMGRGKPLGRP